MSKLKDYRIFKGLTQTELAEKARITKQSINDMESGKCYPSYPVLRRLEKALHCNHRKLFDDPDAPKEAATPDIKEAVNEDGQQETQ